MQAAHDRARRARSAGLLIAAGLVVSAAWILVPEPPGSAAVEDTRTVASPVSDDPIVELAAAEAPTNPRLEAEMQASPGLAAEARRPLAIDLRAPETLAKRASRVDSGRLTVRAIDAVTREPLDHLRVRAANSRRIADRKTVAGMTQVALKLTPDTYTPLLLVPGYEPAELDAVRVLSGAEIELAAEMRRGSASITGVVIGSGSARHAELTGSGRRPCDRCAESASGMRSTAPNAGWNRRDPCAHCGFAADFTRIPVGLAATFAFTDLASGTYALRLADERGLSDGALLLVVLLDAQLVHVAMSAPALRDVFVNLIDVDQVALADSWGANVRDLAAAGAVPLFSLQADVTIEALVWRFAVLEGTEFFGRGEFSTPTPAGVSIRRPAAFGGRRLGLGPNVDDRQRRADEELRPSAEAPMFPDVVLESSVREDGLVRIGGVPAYEFTIRLTCEPFSATVSIPESIGTAIVRAQLERRTEDNSAPATFRALDAARYR